MPNLRCAYREEALHEELRIIHDACIRLGCRPQPTAVPIYNAAIAANAVEP